MSEFPDRLRRLLPPGISVATTRTGDVDRLVRKAGRLGIELPESLKRAVAKRRGEYLAGRISARKALQSIGRGVDGAIESDEDDVPQWPDGVVGSISHGADVAVAAVAPASRFQGLGVDVERLVSPQQASRLGRRVLTDRDRSVGRQALGEQQEAELFTFVFSAKESCYKALFPVYRRVLVFHDLDLERLELEGPEELGGRFSLRPSPAVRDRFGSDEALISCPPLLEGCFAFEQSRVFSLVVATAGASR